VYLGEEEENMEIERPTMKKIQEPISLCWTDLPLPKLKVLLEAPTTQKQIE
jgi:hypothetical protein